MCERQNDGVGLIKRQRMCELLAKEKERPRCSGKTLINVDISSVLIIFRNGSVL